MYEPKDYTGQENGHGVVCLHSYNGTHTCRCACGGTFKCSNFTRIISCPVCRRRRLNANQNAKRNAEKPREPGSVRWRGLSDREPSADPLATLSPAAMWKRICERHRKRETAIDEIAWRRKGD